uniref:Uncharacterized protein LOC102802489 n=1 Tax=Saccoglossus kowalevskii TaxID=10224 RepID=A0ABM0LUD9_SACKO|nr:PREDICTED: uncharacterized protein LOC102802489 [Saccoglossus kowalevskii]
MKLSFTVLDVRCFLSTLEYPPSITDIGKKKALRKFCQSFKLEEDALYYVGPKKVERRRVLFTDEEKEQVFKECHDSPQGAHVGRKKTKHKIKTRYYWRGFDSDIDRWVEHLQRNSDIYEICDITDEDRERVHCTGGRKNDIYSRKAFYCNSSPQACHVPSSTRPFKVAPPPEHGVADTPVGSLQTVLAVGRSKDLFVTPWNAKLSSHITLLLAPGAWTRDALSIP